MINGIYSPLKIELVTNPFGEEVAIANNITLAMTQPVDYDAAIQNTSFTISGTCPSDNAVEIYNGASKLGDATVTDGEFTYSHTFTGTDYNIQLKAVGDVTGDSNVVPIVSSQASTAQTDISAWGRNSYSNYTVTGGHPDPDGGNNAYLIEVTNAFTGELKLSSAGFTGTPDEVDNSLAVWIGSPAGNNINVARMWLRGGTNEVHSAHMMMQGEPYADLLDTYAHLRRTEAASNGVIFSEWVIQQVTDDGDTEVAYDRLVLYAHANSEHTLAGQSYSNTFSVGDKFYIYNPRNISGSLPFKEPDKLAVRHTPDVSGVERNEIRHPYRVDLNDFLDNPSADYGYMHVVKPSGWSEGEEYNCVWMPAALLLTPSAPNEENPRPDTYVAAQGLADTYNTVFIATDLTRSGTDYYCNKSDGTNQHLSLLKDVLKPWAQERLGCTLLHGGLSYSKGAKALLEILIATDMFDHIMIDDGNFDDTYGENFTDTAYGSSANYDAINARTQIAADNFRGVLTTEKRIVIVGSFTFPTDMANIASDFDDKGILYDNLGKTTGSRTNEEHSFAEALENIPALMSIMGVSAV